MPDTDAKLFGLSENEAATLLRSEGPNEIPQSESKRFLIILKDILFEPMFSLIIACGLIYFLLGDPQDALLLLFFLGIIVLITVVQERRTQSALLALRNLTSPRALVLRDGQIRRIPGRDVVRGDLLVLNEGDRIAADGVLREVHHLATDESLLTGESAPVLKGLSDSVFAGTTVTQGRALSSVTATGIKAEMGRIGRLLGNSIPSEKTSLQNETHNFVRRLAWIALTLCLSVVLAFGFLRADWLNGVLSGLTLAMAILPNELPAVIFIFLALGAWRISKKNVLTRNIQAIETLGTATVLCIDKTGTITLNQMQVVKLFISDEQGSCPLSVLDETISLPQPFQKLIETAALASTPNPIDPMEKAILKLAISCKGSLLTQNLKLTKSYPLSTHLLAMTQIWATPSPAPPKAATKGSPESILRLCRLDEHWESRILTQIHEMATQGLRVIAVAQPTLPSQDHQLKTSQEDYNFTFIGLVGLMDPVRDHVSSSIQECRRAGIRVIMMTGDHAETAKAIAQQIGLKNPKKVLTGLQLDQMNEYELKQHLNHTSCFARIRPEQKLRLVHTLKQLGETVAMTGDGVNDAPALKSAQIGIAMGARGTDVARESADLVLTHDDFHSIVESIRVGRAIFDNLKNALAYLLAIHIPIAGMSIIPVFFNLPLLLLPVHIAFLHLIIEPACSIVFEAEPPHPQIMSQPPRSASEALFNRKLIIPSLVQGGVVLCVTLAVFIIALRRGQSPKDARALTFTTLIFSNLSLILVNRSWRASILQGLKTPNQALYWVLIGSLIVLSLILYVPFLRDAFQFSMLHFTDLLITWAGGILSILWFEIWKRFRRSE
jgi:Ca2+-transporting ATPase